MDHASFLHPPAAYRGIPLWSWNDRLERGEVLRQLQALQQGGFGGAFLHPRPGIWTPFLSAEWFAMVEACVEYGRHNGLQLWGYDECSYPSGFAGGLVHDRRPDLVQRCLYAQLLRIDETPSQGLGTFLVHRALDGSLSLRSLEEGAAAGDLHVHFGLHTPPANSWLNGVPYPDLLHPDSARVFLEVAYQPYFDRFHDRFGSVMPGMFTDEPNIRPSGPAGSLAAFPWTEALPDLFRQRYGYDLLPRLADLVYDLEGAARTRYHFWKLVSERFVEVWVEPLYRWCEEHGITFTGHFWEHELSPLPTGSVMLPAAYQHMPGIDLLGRNVARNRLPREDTLPSQIGQVQLVKAVTSVAHQLGRRRILSETYGGAGWEMRFVDQKQFAEWQAVLGVNFLCPHLSHYSLRGPRKHDYPLSFSSHEPWWSDYPVLQSYLSRLYYALSSGDPAANVLVLHPMSSIWIGHRPPAGCAPTGAWSGIPVHMNQRWALDLDNLLKALSAAQWSYDLGDEQLLAQHAAVENARLVVGTMRYQAVILPPCANLARETLTLLDTLLDQGGAVAALAPVPYLCEGQVDARVPEFLRRCHVTAEPQGLLPWLRRAAPRVLRIDQASDETVLYAERRHLDSGALGFIANVGVSPSMGARVRWAVEGNEPWRIERWDLATGEVLSLPTRTVQDGELGSAVEVTLDFARAESHLLRLRPSEAPTPWHPRAGAGLHAVSGTSRTGRHEPGLVVQRRALDGPWSVRRLQPNALVLDRCLWRLSPHANREPWQSEQPIAALRTILSQRYGIPALAFQDIQPWRKYATRAPQVFDERWEMRFVVDLALDPSTTETLDLVLEEAERWEVTVNGTVARPTSNAWIDPSFRRIEVGRLLHRGENVIDVAGHFGEDVGLEPCYIIGDFALETHDFRHFRLIAEPGQLSGGSWVDQGYPFYAGRMVYAKEVTLRSEEAARGRLWLELSDLPAPVAELRCNDQMIGVLAWPPYRAELTAAWQPGTNRIEVEVSASLRNLLGPHHANSRPEITGPGNWHHSPTWSNDYQLVSEGMAATTYLVWGA